MFVFIFDVEWLRCLWITILNIQMKLKTDNFLNSYLQYHICISFQTIWPCLFITKVASFNALVVYFFLFVRFFFYVCRSISNVRKESKAKKIALVSSGISRELIKIEWEREICENKGRNHSVFGFVFNTTRYMIKKYIFVKIINKKNETWKKKAAASEKPERTKECGKNAATTKSQQF